MAESLTALVVPGETSDELGITLVFDKIVGLLIDEDKEIILPDSPGAYAQEGGYSEGYSVRDLTEKPLPLSRGARLQLAKFFDQLLLGKGWRDVGTDGQEKYDCHWLANWLTGSITETTDIDTTVDIAEAMVLHGKKITVPLPGEHVIVMGSIYKCGRVRSAEAHHSFIAYDGVNALQVFGIQGAVGIAPHTDTTAFYKDLSQRSHSDTGGVVELFAADTAY